MNPIQNKTEDVSHYMIRVASFYDFVHSIQSGNNSDKTSYVQGGIKNYLVVCHKYFANRLITYENLNWDNCHWLSLQID
jgi:hypothetical protein